MLVVGESASSTSECFRPYGLLIVGCRLLVVGEPVLAACFPRPGNRRCAIFSLGETSRVSVRHLFAQRLRHEKACWLALLTNQLSTINYQLSTINPSGDARSSLPLTPEYRLTQRLRRSPVAYGGKPYSCALAHYQLGNLLAFIYIRVAMSTVHL